MSSLPRSAASFWFVAATTQGGRKMGVREARDRRALAEILRRERLLLLRAYQLPAWAGARSGLGLKDRTELNEQLAQLLSRGVPLVEALEVTASAVRSAARPLVERMREQVAAGASFAEACHRTGAFDAVTIAVYRAAERTGDLAGAARQLAVTGRRQLGVSNKAMTLLMYPTVVLTISILVSVGFLTLIVPQLGESLGRHGVSLPWYTRVVIGVGTWMRDNFLLLAGVAAAAAIAAIVSRAYVIEVVRRASRRVPLLREVVLAQESSRFFSVMAAMTRSGVPLADALGVGNLTVGLPKLRRQLETLRMRLIEGGVLRVLIENVSALPLATRRLLIAGDRAGDLEMVFESQAQDMAEDVDRRAARLLAVAEPLLIVVMFLIIGTILVAMFVPLITLTSQMM